MLTSTDAPHEAAATYRSAVGGVSDVLELAADVCQAPMAALKIADHARANFAATWGIPATADVPKSRSLCDIVSATSDAVVVDDAPHDPRVAGHPLVAGAARVSFIAAAPLFHDGHVIGALCVFDNERRGLDAATTRRYLERIARRVDTETGLRHLLTARPAVDLPGLDDLVTTISHEIRTPLSAIQGYAETLAEIAPAHAAGFAAITRNAVRLNRTVDSLLRAANQHRHEPVGTPRAVDLASVTAAAAADCGTAAARIVAALPPYPVHVHADRQLLQLAIGHLLSNALGFSAPTEPVRVSITGTARPVLEIQDRGPGLDEHELAMLGTPFFRGAYARRHESPGVGLGLAVTGRILRAQGAGLRFASAAGQGCTARILFP